MSSETVNSARRAVKLLGLIATLASVVFVIWSVRDAGLLNDPRLHDVSAWQVIAVAAVGYAGSLLLLPEAWRLLVGSVGEQSLGRAEAFGIYGRSQIYKYLPTNLLHFVARHAALRARGVSHGAAAWGSVGEAGLISLAALFVAMCCGGVSGAGADERLYLLVVPAIGLVILFPVMAGLAPKILGRWAVANGFAEAIASIDARRAAAAALIIYALFFAMSGLIFAGVATLSPHWSPNVIALLVTIWSGSWILGFVTPGAAAGIGIRETLLIGALAAAGLGSDAVLIAVGMRVVTILGDILLAIAAMFSGVLHSHRV